jgi:membrane protease YdiL (CAAX protease family)
LADAGRAGSGLLGEWLRALGRILLFLAIFLLILVAGSLAGNLFIPGQQAALFVGSLLMAVAAWIAGAVVLRKVEHRPAGALGTAWTSRTSRELITGLAIGTAALACAVLAMLVTGGVRYAPQAGGLGDWAATMAVGFGALAVPAFAEEVLFRGYPFQVLVKAVGAIAATVIASVLFAAAHASNPNVDAFALLNIFLAGVLLSAAYLRTRSLWFATAVHLGWNWSMALLFDLPVSGLEMFDAPLYEPTVAGARWFTGGAFGPEGGLVGTLAFGSALLVVLKAKQVRVAPEMLALRPLGLEAEADRVLEAGAAAVRAEAVHRE